MHDAFVHDPGGGGGGDTAEDQSDKRGGTHHRTDSARKGANGLVGHSHEVNLDIFRSTQIRSYNNHPALQQGMNRNATRVLLMKKK